MKANCLVVMHHACRGIVKRAMSNMSKCVPLYYNDVYEVQLPQNHRFPMGKYRMVRQKLQKEYADIKNVEFFASPLATFEELTTTHCPKYVERYLKGDLTEMEVRRTGFPWSKEHVKRSISSVGGTIAAMRAVLGSADVCIAGHIAGGTHHAFYNYGEGFCIFSDIAVAANLALKEYPHAVQKIMIIDLDVHQGNGNAVLFQHNPNVFTFSMHCKENYFSAKQTSNVDIEVPGGATDADYLAALQSTLPTLLDQEQPQLVFYQAGVDIYEEDKLGKMRVSRAGMQQRNAFVFEQLRCRDIRCVVTMGGGYPKDLNPSSTPFLNLIQCHADVYRSAIEYFSS